jgi:hypothetical protein
MSLQHFSLVPLQEAEPALNSVQGIVVVHLPPNVIQLVPVFHCPVDLAIRTTTTTTTNNKMIIVMIIPKAISAPFLFIFHTLMSLEVCSIYRFLRNRLSCLTEQGIRYNLYRMAHQLTYKHRLQIDSLCLC